jgi:bromodomain and WD repeat domain-containing protein 1/3
MLVATVQGMTTLLGAGRQSLLRTADNISRPRSILEYCTRLHGTPLLDVINRNKNNNIVSVLYGRQSGGPLIRKQAVASSFYTKVALLRQTLGHLSAVYCVLFDRSGKHIVTVSAFELTPARVRRLIICSYAFREPTTCW